MTMSDALAAWQVGLTRPGLHAGSNTSDLGEGNAPAAAVRQTRHCRPGPSSVRPPSTTPAEAMTTTQTIAAPLTGQQTRHHLLSGRADVEDFVARRLAHARAVEASIHAFACLDEGLVTRQAEHLKAALLRGEPPGALFGVPVAIKDIIDTVDFPTACGSPIHAGRQAGADATVVRRLRDAGAVIFGKTVTTEFATLHPGPTRNPNDLAHTPGGSSSGSAAAVAAGVVPVALGTQTNGSMLRPASFCGIYGYKPSTGLLPRTGVFPQSPTLDQVGVFARCIEDLAWVAELMAGDDGHDSSTRGVTPRPLLSVCRAVPPTTPRFCFIKTPWWSQVDDEARAACEAFIDLMQGLVTVVDMPAIAEQAVPWLGIVNEAELACALQHEYRHHADALSPGLRRRVERGMAMPVLDYLIAKNAMPRVTHAFDGHFERFDAILCPAALGSAPKGLASTGNPVMQTVWSFCGLPALSLPLLELSRGLPLGVQAVGSRHSDDRLFRDARWLVQEFLDRSAVRS
ncbi:MAG: amidase [Leptothrix sp. (in: Bacteria)]|nr:amidase [Leptothrix sp. (in: b-proteobacteria)]